MRFAFIIMGFDGEAAGICGGAAAIVGAPDIDSACEAASRLEAEGVGCIELCGAFGPEGARRIIEATGGRVPVGYVVHLPEQDGLYAEVFGHRPRARRIGPGTDK